MGQEAPGPASLEGAKAAGLRRGREGQGSSEDPGLFQRKPLPAPSAGSRTRGLSEATGRAPTGRTSEFKNEVASGGGGGTQDTEGPRTLARMEETWGRVALPGALPWAPAAWLGPPALPPVPFGARCSPAKAETPAQRPPPARSPRPASALAARALPAQPGRRCPALRKEQSLQSMEPTANGARAPPDDPGLWACAPEYPVQRKSAWVRAGSGEAEKLLGSRSNREFRGVRRRSRAWLGASSGPERSGARVWGVVGCGESLEEKVARPSCPRGQKKAVTFD